MVQTAAATRLSCGRGGQATLGAKTACGGGSFRELAAPAAVLSAAGHFVFWQLLFHRSETL